MADGYVMTIPASVLRKLENADSKIQKIAETSEETQRRVVDAFKKMADGINPFIEKLNFLKSLGQINLDASFNRASTAAEKTAASIASVAKQLNAMNSASGNPSAKTAVNDWMVINENLKIQQARLKEINQAIKQYEATLAAMKSGGSGMISKSDTSAYQANIQEAETLKQNIALMQQRQQAIVTYQKEQTNLIKKMEQLKALAQGKNSFVEEKDVRELERLNEAFRKGESELQKRARLTDEYRRSVEASNKADRERTNKFSNQQEKATKAAARAEEQYNEALKRSERTLTQREAKIRALERAQRALNATGRNYAIENNKIASEIQRLSQRGEQATTSIKKLGQAQRHTFDIAGQLERQLALVFSVSAIKDYINQLVTVRGEFELQQRALQSILQNKDQANDIWDKTVQLAVRSPFTVKELVTYTKQLAAYRIEADKLYDTNKMLADVSAGLGVSMDRLILAFGQVKAANFLRASEVRQFTEAGVNILGELANLYTELEGRMVSVAEVQERITKRMVTFGDVEEIFKRITSAGGIFYNMQEIQAETLAGQMSNLRDTFDLMFNDIGKANDGVLKGFVAALRAIVENWELIAAIAVPTIVTLASRFVVLKVAALIFGRSWAKMLLMLRTGFRSLKADLGMATVATNRLNSSMRTLGMTKLSIWTAALSAVVLIVWEIYEALSAASKQQNELNKIAAEGQSNAVSMASNYERLADIVSDSTKSFEEQDEALKELKRTYSDILPAHLLEAKTIRELQGNYEGATQAIYNYIDAKTKEEQVRTLGEEDGKDINEKVVDVAEQLQQFVKVFANKDVELTKFTSILATLNKEFYDGKFSIEEYNTRLNKYLHTATGADLPDLKVTQFQSGIKGWTISLNKARNNTAMWVDSLAEMVSEYKDKMDAIFKSDLGIGNYVEDKFKNEKQEAQKQIQEAQSALNTLVASKQPNSIVTQEQVDNAIKMLQSFYQWADAEAPKLSDIINNSFLIKEETLNINKLGYTKFLSDIGSVKFPEKDFESFNKLFEKVQTTITSFDGTPFQKQIRNLIYTFGETNNISLDGFDKVLAKNEDSITSYLETMTKLLPSIIEQIYLLQSPRSLLRDGLSEEEIKKRVDILTNLKKYVEDFLKNNSMPNNRSGKSEQEKTLERQLKLLKDVKKAYEENRKYYNEEDAATKTRQDYSKAFDQAKFPEGFLMSMDFDPSGIIKSMKEIGSKASGEVALEFEKAIAKVQAEVNLAVKVKGIENLRKSLDDAFSDYELSVQIDDFGVLNKDALMKMMGGTYTSLDDLENILKLKFPDTTKLSEEQLNVYNTYLEKLRDLERKSYRDRLKDATKFFKDTLDEAKRAQMESVREISTLTDLYNEDVISTDQYASGIQQSMKKANDAVSSLNLEKLKQSPEFIQAMGTMAGYSSNELQKLAQRLRELANDASASMTVEDMTKLYDIINKVEQKAEKVKSPFQKSVWSDLKNIIKLQKEYNAELEKYNELKAKSESLQAKQNDVKSQMDALQNSPNAGIDPSDKDNMAALQEEFGQINKDLTSTNSQLGQSGQKLEGIKGGLQGATGGMGAAMGMIDKIVTGIYQSINATIELMNQFKDLAESKGVDTSKGGWREAQQAGEVLGNVNERVMSSWNNFKSGNFAGAIADAVGSITTIFTTLNKQHDARREQDIQDEIKLVNRLSMTYAHLERKIENAYTIDTMNMAYENAERNIEQQMESTKRMIAAEEDKKDSDSERIAQMEDQLIQYEEQLEDLRNKKLQELGGFGSGKAMADAAQEFASAWMEAYMETGDGLDALNEKWDEFIQNIIVKQLALRGVTKFLEPIMKQIDEAIGKDSYLDDDEMAKIRENIDKLAPELNEYWKTIMENFGDSLPQPGSASELSGLQKGIQGITEETAGIIEGYLNSVRFFVSDISIETKRLTSSLLDETIPNPIINELRIQTEQIRSINAFLDSVILSGHRMGRSGIKVFID